VTTPVPAFEEQCIAAIVRVVGAGTVLASAELLYLRKEWSEQGLFNWPVTRTRFSSALRNGSIALLDAVCDYPRYIRLVGLQLLCGLVLLVNLLPSHRLLLLLAILFVHLLTMLRNHGTDGADQMQTILLASLACYYATPDPIVKKAAIWFVALQAILAYFTAGVAKLWSRAWRKGTVLRESLALGPGCESLYQCLPRGSRTNQILCLSVVAYECLFPVVFILGPTLCWVFLTAGVLLHVGNAFAFGLPRFVFTFVAAYPAILFFLGDIRSAPARYLFGY